MMPILISKGRDPGACHKPRFWFFVLLPGLCFSASFLLNLAATPAAGQVLDACRAAPQVKAALEALPAEPRVNQSYNAFYGQKEASLRALLERYPADLFINRSYIEFESAVEGHDKVVSRYAALAQSHPGEPEYLYLKALALTGQNTPEAIKLLQQVLAEAPKSPWPRLELAEIYGSPNFHDAHKQAANLAAFLNACPSSLEGYDQLYEASTGDRPLLATAVKRLRRLLENRNDASAIAEYPVLWGLEFRLCSQAEYSQVRNQIKSDLKRIRALNFADKSQWYEALKEGYKLVSDSKNQEWAKGEEEKRFPSHWEPPGMEAWLKSHTEPDEDATPAKKRAYYQSLLAEANKWIAQTPYSFGAQWYRLSAIQHLENAPLAEIREAGEGYLKTSQADSMPSDRWGYQPFLNVADFYSAKEVLPDRIVALAQQGLSRLAQVHGPSMDDLYRNAQWESRWKFDRDADKARGLALEATGYLMLKDRAKTQAVLSQLQSQLPIVKTAAAADEAHLKTYAERESSCWELMARVAELKGQRVDAMAFYETALQARLRSAQIPAPGERDRLVASARRLWSALGGTEEGWQAWYGRPAALVAAQNRAHLEWVNIHRPLAPFKLADLAGKTWTLASLKGKVTLLNFWASW